ncbi:MAG: hypothetical protein ACI4VQ_02355 [Clostridia bacterium]
MFIIKFKNINKIFTCETEKEIEELEWQTGQEIEEIKEVEN